MLDLEYVRSRFPALATEWALFDNAGGSVPLAGVIDAIADYMRRYGVQLGASHALSVEAAGRVELGHSAAARLVGAEPGEVVLGSSSTANVRLLARALRPWFSPGDEVVVTDLDHECHVGAWRELEDDGVRVREWRFDRERHELTLAGLEPVLGERTRLVCFTHVSNVVGRIHDVAAFTHRIHQAGALACVDGVAFAPHRRVDVRALGVDFYFVSLYKTFGPHLGLLYGRRELLRRARGQYHYFVPEDAVPHKLEPGGPQHELAASLPAIERHLLDLEARTSPAGATARADRLAGAFAAIAAHEATLVAPLLGFLRGRRGVHVLGGTDPDPAGRVATVAFTAEDMNSASIPPRLDERRVAVRYGHFYAHRAIGALGLHERNGVVRASLAHYNTPAEVERLIGALDDVLP